MFRNIITAVKSKLTDNDFASGDFAIYDFRQAEAGKLRTDNVELFNNQYAQAQLVDGTQLWIEIGTDNKTEQASKSLKRMSYTLRLHIVNKQLSSNTGGYDTDRFEQHDAIIDEIRTALDGFRPTPDSRRLSFSNHKPHTSVPGWMISFMDFDSKLNL